MTRKDYIAIARVISDAALIQCGTQSEVELQAGVRRRIAHELSDILAKDNPRFDRERFLKACGIA